MLAGRTEATGASGGLGEGTSAGGETMVRYDAAMSSTAAIKAYIDDAPAFARPICRKLRSVVRKADDRLVEEIKWGAPAYVHEGIVCSIAAFKKHVALWLHKGALLDDPKKLLQPGKKAQTMKVLHFESTKDIDEAAITRFVRAAVELNVRGVEAPKTRRPVEVPPALAAALRKKARARKTFEALAPSHRREYAEWIAEAKRPDTVTRRIAKTIELLEAGKTKNDAYRRTR
jgi:uncharacterized protein YdeI (YjbR/CyaY-like superfamily)